MKLITLDDKSKEIVMAQVAEYIKNLHTLGASVNIPLNNSKKAEGAERPKIILSLTATAKILDLVDASREEIAWHGTVYRNKETNTYTIKDIFVFPQFVTSATVTSDDDTYGEWLFNFDDDTFNHMRMHGHSHVNMGVSPSMVDTSYQEDMLKDVKDFYVYLIINKRTEIYACIYDIEMNTMYDTLDIDVVLTKPIEAGWGKAQMAQYIKQRPVTTYGTTMTGTGFNRKAEAFDTNTGYRQGNMQASDAWRNANNKSGQVTLLNADDVAPTKGNKKRGRKTNEERIKIEEQKFQSKQKEKADDAYMKYLRETKPHLFEN